MADLPNHLSAALANRYRLERELGRGGMATVYLAHDLRHKRLVALKVLHPDLAQTLGPERFQREIETVARLQHPHILTVHDSGEAAGQLWFTMPFVEGESLRDRLSRETQLPVEDALRICIDAARALEYAHEHGVVHRDIKPENLLLTKDGSTLVADFGIARAVSGSGEQLTQTGMSVGTPTYMSPEQAAGDRTLDARTDVYSLGTVLYEMLAGEPPFTGPTAQAVIAKCLIGEVPRLRHVRPSVPESVEQAVTRALAPVAADRFASSAEFARALQPSHRGAAPGPTAPVAAASPGANRRRRVPVAAMALVLGVLIGLGVLFAWRRSHPGGDDASVGPKRVAVLPFENLGDSADAYFADGITDEVRGKLAGLAGLQVIARASSMEYHARRTPVQQVARELGVQYVLTGRVRWSKEANGSSRVQVIPELVQATEGDAPPTTKWQQSFAAELTDVFQVQGEIARQVAQALDLELAGGELEELVERPTGNVAAYQEYLQGNAASAGLAADDPASLRRALRHYQRAIALDSTFAPAWAQLAQVHGLLFISFPGSNTEAEARVAAERAVALAPELPEARLGLGIYYAAVVKDPQRAAEQMRLGLRSAPNDPDLLTGAAQVGWALGRWEESLPQLRHATALDPRSANTIQKLGQALVWLRRYPEARQVLERTLSMDPDNLGTLQLRTMVELGQGDLPAARAVLRSAPAQVESALAAYMAVFWDLPWVLPDTSQRLLLASPPELFGDDRLGWALVEAQLHLFRGDSARARAFADSARSVAEEGLRALPEDAQLHALGGVALAMMGRREAIEEGKRAVALLPLAKEAYFGPYIQHQLARIYILLGEPEMALDQLEPLLKVPYYLSPGWLRIDPNFAPLRGNPRFERLVNSQ